VRAPAERLGLSARPRLTAARSVLGPAGTPYEGGKFVLDVRLTAQYPFDAPGVRFVTKIYHANVDETGRICLDSLKLPPAGSWRPSLNLVQVLSQIQILFSEPGLGDPLRPEVADVYKSDRERFDRTAREWTERYAMRPALAGGAASAAAGSGSSSGPAAKRAREAE